MPTLRQRDFQLYRVSPDNLTFVELLAHGRDIHSEGPPHMREWCLRPGYQVLKCVQFRYHF
jgi:hypothetical protein